MNLPNQLTLARLLLCAVFTVFMSIDAPYTGVAALVVFILASLTDWLDGHLARKWNQITDLGKLLDPLADKILISAAFIGFVAQNLAPMWVVVCIIARELLITGLRTVAASKGVVLAAERIGKHKTISQMVTAILALLILSLRDTDPAWSLPGMLEMYVLQPMLYVTLAITVFSGIAYFAKNQALVFASLEEKPKG
jgi:CDP-diacylglycerol--glycerol-3-phosphate 3-phosphatidyltransferase